MEVVPADQQPLLALAAETIRCVTQDPVKKDEKSALEIDPAILKRFKLAVQELDAVWNNFAPAGAPSLFTDFLEKYPTLKKLFENPGASLATWYAWDILQGLHQDDSFWKDIPFRTAAAPVLFVDEVKNRGLVALLTIELLRDGGSGFTPIPESLGLTALATDFHAAMQRAWKLSGIEGWRGRWKLSQFPGSTDKLNVPLLRGRSLEAATCATLWSAFGSIPGTDQTTPDPPIKTRRQPLNTTDLRTAITAQLGELPKNGKRDEIPLVPIDGLVSKYKAARDAELEVVIVAEKQDPQATEGWLSSQAARLGTPTRLPTIGKAWDWIHADVQFLRNFQTDVKEKWGEQWTDEVDVPEEATETSHA